MFRGRNNLKSGVTGGKEGFWQEGKFELYFKKG